MFLYEHKHIARFSNLHWCTFSFSLDINGNWDLPNNLNAAVTNNERNYFFKGCKYYAYNDESWKGSIGWTGDIRSKGGWNAECDLDAAVSWRGKTYLFKGEKVWTWEYEGSKYVDQHTIHHSRWSKGNVEGNLDAGLSLIDKEKSYLLKGNKYWRLESDGQIVQGVTLKGWKGLLESDLLPDCACDCNSGIIVGKWEFVSIKFDTNGGQVRFSPPAVVGKKVINNLKGTQSPSIAFTVAKEVVERESFSHTAGASLTVGTEFKTGVPIVAEGKVKVEFTVSYQFQYGKEKEKKTTKSATFRCPAGPKLKVTCLVTLSTQEMSVPYTMKLRHKQRGCECFSNGTYDKISATNMHMEILEETGD